LKKAFLFDLNGTMIDDMVFHIKAWHSILNDLGAELTMEEVKEQCYGKNGELLERIFPGRFTEDEKDSMSIEKEKAYQAAFRPMLKLIHGLDAFLKHADDLGVKMAIGSAAIQFNIDFVLDGLNIRHYFPAIVSAEQVSLSKPHPETYLECADRLGIRYSDCIVFEDAPKGVEAAQNAGMECVVITTMHEQNEFAQYSNISCFIKDYRDPQLSTLFQ